MIRILSEDHDSDFIKRSQIESIEDIGSFGIDNISLFFFFCQEFLDICKIWLSEFISQDSFPRNSDLNIIHGNQKYEKKYKADTIMVYMHKKKLFSEWHMRSLFWIEQHIDRSDTYQSVDNTSKKAISKNSSNNIEIEQSQQSSIESSDNQKHPRNRSKKFWISVLFHSYSIWKIKTAPYNRFT